MNLKFYTCSSTEPRNNGLVKECTIRLELDEGLTHHCPICASLMLPDDDGPSISELLKKGLEEEKKKGMHK